MTYDMAKEIRDYKLSYSDGFFDGRQAGFEAGYLRGWKGGYSEGRSNLSDWFEQKDQHDIDKRAIDATTAMLWGSGWEAHDTLTLGTRYDRNSPCFEGYARGMRDGLREGDRIGLREGAIDGARALHARRAQEDVLTVIAKHPAEWKDGKVATVWVDEDKPGRLQ